MSQNEVKMLKISQKFKYASTFNSCISFPIGFGEKSFGDKLLIWLVFDHPLVADFWAIFASLLPSRTTQNLDLKDVWSKFSDIWPKKIQNPGLTY